jgi:hypothetical protein
MASILVSSSGDATPTDEGWQERVLPNYPMRRDRYARTGVERLYGSSRIPLPNPCRFVKTSPNRVGKRLMPRIKSRFASRIPVPQRLVDDQEDASSSTTESSLFVCPSAGATLIDESLATDDRINERTRISENEKFVEEIAKRIESTVLATIENTDSALGANKSTSELSACSSCTVSDKSYSLSSEDGKDPREEVFGENEKRPTVGSEMTVYPAESSTDGEISSQGEKDSAKEIFDFGARKNYQGPTVDSATTVYPAESSSHIAAGRSLTDFLEDSNDVLTDKILESISLSDDDEATEGNGTKNAEVMNQLNESNISYEELLELQKWVIGERKKLEKQLEELNSMSTNILISCQLAFQGIYHNFFERINWANVDTNLGRIL